MKALLSKYKRSIIFWTLFSAILFYFAPLQHEYYLDNDIANFKATYFTPFLVWTGVIISVSVLMIVLVGTKYFKSAGVYFLSIGLILAVYLFIFNELLLSGALFVNRQFTLDKWNKSYIVGYMIGMEKTKKNFVAYDLSTNQSSIDRKLINKLYKSELHENDTITLKFDKGLFGIAFLSQPFKDE